MIKHYILKKPLLGWSKGEHVKFDTDWGEWTRQKTGETYDLRGSIGSGEVALFFNALMNNKLTTIFEPVGAAKDKS